MRQILTAKQGNNADLLVEVFSLYAKPNDIIADVTYGKGAFWKNLDKSLYHVLESDLQTGIDFRCLPYTEKSVDILILDPPYMHGGNSIKQSINKQYNNNNTDHSSVIRLYASGILEAHRVLKKKGLIFIKCQDEIESGKQKLSHVEILSLLELLGFFVVDLFVLIQNSIPTQRFTYQKHARKNHSYLIIGQTK